MIDGSDIQASQIWFYDETHFFTWMASSINRNGEFGVLKALMCVFHDHCKQKELLYGQLYSVEALLDPFFYRRQ